MCTRRTFDPAELPIKVENGSFETYGCFFDGDSSPATADRRVRRLSCASREGLHGRVKFPVRQFPIAAVRSSLHIEVPLQHTSVF